MQKIIVIPSRMGSSRFKNKPMVKIMGMPMVGHCYYRAKLAKDIDEVYVATCDIEISEYIKSIGGKSIMTSISHKRASTRTAEAVKKIEKIHGYKIPIIIMVQGDEPVISPLDISKVLSSFSEPDITIVNIMSRLHELEEFEDRNNVKVVVDSNNNALYFSREPIPSPWNGWRHLPKYMQTGIIAFRRDTLLNFNAMHESTLEQIESIDMNRVLEAGGSVRMVITETRTLGVDIEEDVKYAEDMLASDPITKEYLKL